MDRLPPNRAAPITVWKAAIFHAAPGCVPHWRWTSSICVASYTPPMSTFAASTASASVPRIGPEVMTGEQTRMRFCAEAIDRDIAWTSLRLRPGQKYGRTRVPSGTDVHGHELRPERATTGLSHSPWKLSAKSAAISPEATVNITFSSRFHESFVQFVEPVSTSAASRTTYLWCIRSGTPGIGFTCTPTDSKRCTNDQSISGGGGTWIAKAWSWLNMSRTATPLLTAD